MSNTSAFVAVSNCMKSFVPKTSSEQPQISEHVANQYNKFFEGYFYFGGGDMTIEVGADDNASLTLSQFPNTPVNVEPMDSNGGGTYRTSTHTYNNCQAGFYHVSITYENIGGIAVNLSQLTVKVNGESMVLGTLEELRNVEIVVSGEVSGYYNSAVSFPREDGKYYKAPVYSMTVEGTDASGNALSDDFDAIRFMPGYNPSSNPDPDYSTRIEYVQMVGLADAQSYTISKYKEDYVLHGTEAPADDGALVVTGTHYLHDGPNDDDEVFGAFGCIEMFGNKGFAALKKSIKEIAGAHEDSDTEAVITYLCSNSKLRIVLEATSRPAVISTGVVESD